MKATPSGAAGPRKRDFSVADGLVLICAVAAGSFLVRGWKNPQWTSFRFGIPRAPGGTPDLTRRIVDATVAGVSWTIPFAMTLTVALLVLRFRSPRPSIRRIARQPGMVACASAIAAIAFRFIAETFLWGLGYLTRPRSAIRLPSPPFVRLDNPGLYPPPEEWLRNVLLEIFPESVSASVAVSIAVVWCVLWAGGRWRPSADWIERSGKWLGAYWIALGVVIAAVAHLSKFVE